MCLNRISVTKTSATSIVLLFSFSLFGMSAIQDVKADQETIPEWVRGVFGWYAQGNISEAELIQALQFLIDTGILDVGIPGAGIIAKPILDKSEENVAKYEGPQFFQEGILEGEKADRWMEEQISYGESLDTSEWNEILRQHNGDYHLVIVPEKYGKKWTLTDTDGYQLSYHDTAVIPMHCYTYYVLTAENVSSMYLTYNYITIDMGIDQLFGLCRD